MHPRPLRSPADVADVNDRAPSGSIGVRVSVSRGVVRQKLGFVAMMPPMKTHPCLTAIETDAELLRWWLSGRARTTYGVYRGTARQFLAFLGKPLRDARVEDILLWLESFQLRL